MNVVRPHEHRRARQVPDATTGSDRAGHVAHVERRAEPLVAPEQRGPGAGLARRCGHDPRRDDGDVARTQLPSQRLQPSWRHDAVRVDERDQVGHRSRGAGVARRSRPERRLEPQQLRRHRVDTAVGPDDRCVDTAASRAGSEDPSSTTMTSATPSTTRSESSNRATPSGSSRTGTTTVTSSPGSAGAADGGDRVHHARVDQPVDQLGLDGARAQRRRQAAGLRGVGDQPVDEPSAGGAQAEHPRRAAAEQHVARTAEPPRRRVEAEPRSDAQPHRRAAKRAQLVGEGREHLGAVRRIRGRRVAEDAVRGHGRQPGGPDRLADLAPARRAARLDPIDADRLGVEVQHHRRLGATCVGITAGHLWVPHRHVAALGDEQRRATRQCLDVAAVAVDEQHRAEGPRSRRPRRRQRRAAQFDDDRLERRRADRQRARERLVLARGADRDRWTDDRVGTSSDQPLAQLRGDAEVGVERQVRSVLLAAADRHDQQLRIAGLGPRTTGEPVRTRHVQRTLAVTGGVTSAQVPCSDGSRRGSGGAPGPGRRSRRARGHATPSRCRPT